ncbi:MAG TPA: hypothetical protein VH394_27975 [Thermoanaerobaculia bacterium]|nr:hypothetical protein [Thermoanaerobaculia bacterium]
MRTKLLFLSLLLVPFSIWAEVLPCMPCAGVRFEPVQSVPISDAEPLNPAPAPDVQAAPAQPAVPNNPADFVALLKQAQLEKGSPLFVAWEVPLDGTANPGDTASQIVEAGGTPWISLVFRTPAPVAQNAERLQTELRAAVAIASSSPAQAWFQIVWRPEGQEGQMPPAEYAFLIKRAAVTLTGARADARVASDALPADPKFLETFYGEEVTAYVDAVALRSADGAALEAAATAVQNLDPGRPVVLDSAPLPAAAGEVLSDSARNAVRGIGLTLFRASEVGPAVLSPLALLAREFTGDVSYGAGDNPAGASEAWTFVRSGKKEEDVALRVIALAPEGTNELTLKFPDPYLRRPSRFPYTRDKIGAPQGEVQGQNLVIRLDNPGRVAVIGLERATAAEREGVEEKVSVATEREMPVEEILRRLQAFEDAQDRKLDHYQAVNTTHLRFQPAAGSQTFEATLQGPFFVGDKTGSDWAWQTLYVNGVKWRSKSIPEIPLVQPEKAAALPLQIHFTKQYRYRLRGTDKVDGRDAWVVDFAPAGPGEPGKLYQGTVWVDRQIYARLKTRAVQVGLEGEVISNEETMTYTPIDANGQPAAWSGESFVLPLKIVAQQILSVVNATTVVERETELTEVKVNSADFEEKRKQVAETDVTMVRDTDKGLRYLVKEEGSEDRVVKEGFDTNKLFLAGGVFYDDALDYPLPLGGVNYFDFNFRNTGKQVNVFFAGALLTANAAEPRLFGSKFDLGAQLFALAVPFADTLYRDGAEVPAEEVNLRTGSFGLKLGRPLGNFIKVGLDYDVLFLNYGDTDNTADGFVPPSDNQTHSLEGTFSFSRGGYGFSTHYGLSRRSQWDPWGFPDNPDYSADKKEFTRWGARLSKNWYLPHFQKVGAEVDYVSGSDLDRFNKYQFGFFGSTRVHGYQSNRVRAEEALAVHGTYGFEVGELLRLDAVGDVAWATDEATGLDNELLGGVGLAGTFIGPWQTVVNLDVGVPVAGPDDGFVFYIVFLKLFK